MTDNEIKAVRKIMSTDLSRAYEELEAKVVSIYKLSCMTLDDIIRHLMKGDIFVSSDLINRLQAENENLEYKLTGVMHFVDKWLDGAELEQDEVNRASAMREKTLQIVESQQAEIERLKKAVDIHKGIAEDWKYEAKRLKEMVGEG